ncbi:hypothetical protein [Actinoplanes sp. NPDC051851]|uniref:hypothetical protein n=1 Tax=Actinoplanes sp. NPDC051851 TaxID=3154753 RepID=UPI00344A52C8
MPSTTTFALPYPALSSAPNVPQDLQLLAAAIDLLLTPVLTTTTASIGTVSSGFTVNDVRAITLLGGRLIFLDLYLSNTAAITVTSGNMTDTTVFTLVSALWPSHYTSFVWGNGSVGGEGNVISTSGEVSLRAASDSIAAGTNIRISTAYLRNP